MRDDEQIGADEVHEVEVVDGEVVEAPIAWSTVAVPESRAQRAPAWPWQPGLQTAVAVATGFVAGAATLALLRRHALTRGDQSVGQPGGSGYPQHRQVRTFVVHVRPLPPQSS